MSIDYGNPDVPVAVCDQCGERKMLDVQLDPESDGNQVRAAMQSIGWVHRAPERVSFPAGFRRQTVVYPQDFCADCQTDEPGPAPLFGAGRMPGARLENDPVDEWPRALIWEAAGLRPDCGHPPGPVGRCGYCELGLPLGHTR